MARKTSDDTENMTSVLYIRCSPEMKEALEARVQRERKKNPLLAKSIKPTSVARDILAAALSKPARRARRAPEGA